MTNEEWLDHMAHNDIPGLRAWFKAEHVESPGSGALVQCAQIDGEGHERAAEGDTEPQNADSRERLEAEIESYSAFDMMDTITLDMVIGWLDRQAAITERECRKPNWYYCETCETLAELTAERDELKGQVFTLKSECDDLESTCNVLENELYNAKAERERYRSKFGKCLDYADDIHALMDDEGLA